MMVSASRGCPAAQDRRFNSPMHRFAQESLATAIMDREFALVSDALGVKAAGRQELSLSQGIRWYDEEPLSTAATAPIAVDSLPGKFDALHLGTAPSSTGLRSGARLDFKMTGMAEELGREPLPALMASRRWHDIIDVTGMTYRFTTAFYRCAFDAAG